MEQLPDLAKSDGLFHEVVVHIGMRVFDQVFSFEATRPVTVIRNTIFRELR